MIPYTNLIYLQFDTMSTGLMYSSCAIIYDDDVNHSILKNIKRILLHYVLKSQCLNQIGDVNLHTIIFIVGFHVFLFIFVSPIMYSSQVNGFMSRVGCCFHYGHYLRPFRHSVLIISKK